MQRLKKRADFVKVARGLAVRMPGFVLQFLDNNMNETNIGFTVTKRQGIAVTRNRIKRRLREAVRISNDTLPVPAGDYVLIGRKESLKLSFAALQADIAKAFARANRAEGH